MEKYYLWSELFIRLFSDSFDNFFQSPGGVTDKRKVVLLPLGGITELILFIGTI